jgi:hypothetical protein
MSILSESLMPETELTEEQASLDRIETILRYHLRYRKLHTNSKIISIVTFLKWQHVE